MRTLFLLSALILSWQPVSAKNVVFFLGDGMGISTVTASRIYVGQKLGQPGEEHQLSFDKFGNVALIKTYNTNAQVADSAGTITAIMSGAKTRIGVIGVNRDVPQSDCLAAQQNELPNLLELAEVYGKATGIVSTARITHATPAGSYAHTPNRNWENAAVIPDEAEAQGCRDIARQLVEFNFGDGPDVVLGGGRSQFTPPNVADPEYPSQAGLRDDGRNLIQAWLEQDKTRRYVWNQEGFRQLPQKGGQVLGLFEPSHMQFDADREHDAGGEPSLADMTRFALNRLQQSEQGFFLLVEAGRIDHAHHLGNAYRALQDTAALDQAVATVMQMVDLEDTLILVTADHSHTLTISGYPPRGNPILGKVEQKQNQFFLSAKAQPYTTLSYANGPGYQTEYPDLTEVDTTTPNYRQVAAVPLPVETHAGEDVAAYAEGLNAEAVRGVMDQEFLFYVMHAALFGSGG